MELTPRLIFWEITQACNLSCPYCRREGNSFGLSLKESLQIIDSVTKDYKPLLVFSGGEPLLHPDFFEIASYAKQKNIAIALATNATFIDQDLAKRIKLLGFHRVAVSLDGASAYINDSLRGEGTFLKAMGGIRYLVSQQAAALQINTTVTRKNVKDIPAIYKFCLELKVAAWHIFAFVPVGCGISVPSYDRLSAEEYEDFLEGIVDLSLKSEIEIKVTCAPHYNRIRAERLGGINSITNKGCLAASGICFISAKGEVYPCGYLAQSAGNILKDGFKKIWSDSTIFNKLRHTSYLKGRCSICEYNEICGGCRARAFADKGDYLEEEPDCVYQPLSVKS